MTAAAILGEGWEPALAQFSYVCGARGAVLMRGAVGMRNCAHHVLAVITTDDMAELREGLRRRPQAAEFALRPGAIWLGSTISRRPRRLYRRGARARSVLSGVPATGRVFLARQPSAHTRPRRIRRAQPEAPHRGRRVSARRCRRARCRGARSAGRGPAREIHARRGGARHARLLAAARRPGIRARFLGPGAVAPCGGGRRRVPAARNRAAAGGKRPRRAAGARSRRRAGARRGGRDRAGAADRAAMAGVTSCRSFPCPGARATSFCRRPRSRC